MSSITIIDILVNSELGELHKNSVIKLIGIPKGKRWSIHAEVIPANKKDLI